VSGGRQGVHMTATPHDATPNALVIEDDAASAELVRAALEHACGCDVVLAADGFAGASQLAHRSFDIVLTDVELPDANGLELARRSKRLDPTVPLVVLTGHERFEYALDALRSGADAFLTKPVRTPELVATVSSLLDRSRAPRRATPVVLAIGAHPDDVEIGCGGALIRHAAEGHQVWVHTLTQGERGGDRPARVLESQAAAEIIGARLIVDDLPDTSVPEAGPTIEAISAVIERIAPTHVYTHSWNDNHQDHRAVHRATLVAARRVPEVACYQAPSTSIGFAPSRFVDVTPVIERKLDAVRAFYSQWSTRGYLDDELIRSTARYWSRFGGGRYAEPLEIVRAGDPVPASAQPLAA